MSEAPDREEIRRRARAKVVQLGYRLKPEPGADAAAPAAEPLPTLLPGALRQLMHRGHLTPGQMVSARALFADARRLATDDPDGDAA